MTGDYHLISKCDATAQSVSERERRRVRNWIKMLQAGLERDMPNCAEHARYKLRTWFAEQVQQQQVA